MPSPFPCSPVIRECSWKKTQIEKKNKQANKEQGLIKWRKGFLRARRGLLNNVKTGINFSTADNESKNGELNVTIHNQSSSNSNSNVCYNIPTTTATFAASDETFSVS